MAKIAIKFGYPVSFQEQELLSVRAVENDCSLEWALCYEFRRILDGLQSRKSGNNFFDLIFFLSSGEHVRSPSLDFGTFVDNGHKLPMIILEKDYLLLEDSKRIFISDEYINELGSLYQDEFDYEFVGFERF